MFLCMSISGVWIVCGVFVGLMCHAMVNDILSLKSIAYEFSGIDVCGVFVG